LSNLLAKPISGMALGFPDQCLSVFISGKGFAFGVDLKSPTLAIPAILAISEGYSKANTPAPPYPLPIYPNHPRLA
jgi:hypothetical protein